MSRSIRGRASIGYRPRGLCCLGAAVALLYTGLLAGCGDELEREFRQAAIGGLETGLRAITDGLLDGLFAVADPNDGGATAGGS